MTVDPATVMVQIPTAIRDSFDEVITVEARVSDAVLEQLQPNVKHTQDAAIQFHSKHDVSDVTFEPGLVSITFTIQSKTQKTSLQGVHVLIAGPAIDLAKYKLTLPRTIVPQVTIEAHIDLIKGIESGDVTVFAIVRLASRDLEQGITEKPVTTFPITTFLAIMEDGKGHEVVATVEPPALLEIELKIEKIPE